jgi:hypothetical protein
MGLLAALRLVDHLIAGRLIDTSMALRPRFHFDGKWICGFSGLTATK